MAAPDALQETSPGPSPVPFGGTAAGAGEMALEIAQPVLRAPRGAGPRPRSERWRHKLAAHRPDLLARVASGEISITKAATMLGWFRPTPRGRRVKVEPEPEPHKRESRRARKRRWTKPPAPPPVPGSREAIRMQNALTRLRDADPAMAERVERGEVTLTTAMRRAGLWAYPSPPKSKPAPRMSTEWPEAVDATQAALLAIEDRLDGDEAALVDLGTRERLIARRRELASELDRMKTQALSGAAPSALNSGADSAPTP